MRHASIVALTAIVLALGFLGCGNDTPRTGTNAPISFVKGVSLPNGIPLIGFDISYVDPTSNAYYLSANQFAGVVKLDLSTLNSSAPSVSIISPAAPNNFAGSLPFPGDDFAGGPNGILVVNGTEIWAPDSNTYSGGGVNPDGSGPNASYSNDNCNSSVKVINVTTLATTTVYTNGCHPSDELSYDPTDKIILVANPDEAPFGVNKPGVPAAPFVTLISSTTKQILAQLAFDGSSDSIPNATGGIEQSVYSPATKLFYVAVPQDGGDPLAGAIAIVDPVKLAVVGKFPLQNCTPSGMALGPDQKEVFLACNSNTGPQVVSLVDGKVLAKFPQSIPIYNGLYFGSLCDEAWYDPHSNIYVATCNFTYDNANFTVVDAGTGLDASKIKFRENVMTNPGAFTNNTPGAAHSIAVDPATGAIIVPLPMGDPLCPTGNGCLGIFAAGGKLQ